MADTTHAGEPHGPSFGAYMAVAAVLSVATISSFFFNTMAQNENITHFTSFVLILSVAILKATLVGLIFMHLKWDWRLLYFLLIPAFILGVMMMVVLMPDALLGPSRDAAEQLQIAQELQR
ncbi:MAG: cytochrome C oxidase subunit IV family protein [Gemmataceae bacterium]